MNRDLLVAAVLGLVGLQWLLLNTKLRAQPAKFITYVLMWAFLLASSVVAVHFAWTVLS